MRTFLIFCISFSFLALGGQKVEKLDRQAAEQAWMAVGSLPDNTPDLKNGGIVVERELNGTGRRVWFVTEESGTYLFRGKTCDGGEMRLGELYWEVQPGYDLSVWFLDTNAMGMAASFAPQVCVIEVIRLDKGRIERISVEINPWQPPTGPKLQFGSEGMNLEGRYYVSVAQPLAPGAVAILGRNIIGEVKATPFGSVITFPAGIYLPPMGPTTLTICQEGQCSSVVYERKTALEPPPYSGGKG